MLVVIHVIETSDEILVFIRKECQTFQKNSSPPTLKTVKRQLTLFNPVISRKNFFNLFRFK